MIVVDTNLLSEVLKPSPSGVVLHWLAAQEPLDVFTTAITQAELLHGAELLASGKRKVGLSAAIEKMLDEEFRDQILPFDDDAARAFAKIMVARDASGRPISQFDAMIAAIARSRRAAVATRNTADFEGCGIRLINPWSE